MNFTDRLRWHPGGCLLLFLVPMLLAASPPSRPSSARIDFIDDSIFVAVRAGVDEAYRSMKAYELITLRHHVERHLEMREDYLLLYYGGLIDYRLALISMDNAETKKKAEQYLERARTSLERSISLKKDFDEHYILLGAVIGVQISLQPAMAPLLGMQAEGYLGKARTINPRNPRLLLVEGMSLRSRPAFIGGSKEKALNKFIEAVDVWKGQRETSAAMPQWGYDEAYVWLIRTCLDLQQSSRAEQFIAEALSTHPNNLWLKTTIQRHLDAAKAKSKGKDQ